MKVRRDGIKKKCEEKEVIYRCVCMRVCVDVCNRDIYSSSFFEEVTS